MCERFSAFWLRHCYYIFQEKTIQSDYFKSATEQSEYAPFSNHDSSSFGDWLLSAIKRAMSDIQKSADEKRKFDSIGHKGMFGFGK